MTCDQSLTTVTVLLMLVSTCLILMSVLRLAK